MHGSVYEGGVGFAVTTWRWWASELKPGGRSVLSRFPHASDAPRLVQMWVASYGWRRYRGNWGCHRVTGYPPG